jgi:plastocyanin
VRKLIALAASAAVAAAFAVPAFGATKTITVGDDFFKPKTLKVKKGTKLVFKWRGKNPHNVTGAGLKSGTKTKGTYRARARRSGKIVCTIHPGMTMRLKVRK